jgi:hypothetical protein
MARIPGMGGGWVWMWWKREKSPKGEKGKGGFFFLVFFFGGRGVVLSLEVGNDSFGFFFLKNLKWVGSL